MNAIQYILDKTKSRYFIFEIAGVFFRVTVHVGIWFMLFAEGNLIYFSFGSALLVIVHHASFMMNTLDSGLWYGPAVN